MGAVEQRIEQRRLDFGMSVAELSRRTGIEYQRLYQELKGNQGMKASELVVLCGVLGIDIEDFKEGGGDAGNERRDS